jgi:hypothetical protein
VDGGEDVGFKRAFDDRNPGGARKIGEIELEGERRSFSPGFRFRGALPNDIMAGRRKTSGVFLPVVRVFR